jgi:excisionase family DNA binding protein
MIVWLKWLNMTKLSIENDSQKLLNVHKAASFLTVSVTTIRRWAQSRKIIGTKVGVRGDWRFTKKDLLKMMKRNNEQ